ncbi:MAG: hydantoinase/oxoprolinase N-terminal domain-containing protein, partial [Pseudomonadota bacterium]
MTTAQWEFWIDRGGTFTDIVARTPAGEIKTHKLLSENPEQYEDAALAGIRHFLDCGQKDAIPADKINAIKMGTTVGTNALLERKGDPTVLVITRGLKDQLRIGYQNRPKLFERQIHLPEMLYSDVIEATERVSANGDIVTPLDEESLRADLERARSAGINSCAIAFLHGYRYHAHEARAAEIAAELG